MSNVSKKLSHSYFGKWLAGVGAFVGAGRRSLALFERSEFWRATDERQRRQPTVPLWVRSERDLRRPAGQPIRLAVS